MKTPSLFACFFLRACALPALLTLFGISPASGQVGKIVYQQYTNAFANNGSPSNPGDELMLMDGDGMNKTVIAGRSFLTTVTRR